MTAAGPGFSAVVLKTQEGNVFSFMTEEWNRLTPRLKLEFGEAAFRSWLQNLCVVAFEGGCVRLGAPSRFVRDWVAREYADRIRQVWNAFNPSVHTVEIITCKAAPAAPLREDSSPSEVPGSIRPANENADVILPPLPDIVVREEQQGVSAALDPRFTFENFIVGRPNELAYAAARRVADSDVVQFNPLFLYGGVGLGKTHLMHAIAWAIRARNPERKVLYLSAEKFMYQFIRAVRYKDTMAFKEQFRNVDVLMIDDIQFIGGKESTQEEFFHTFNALADCNRQIVVSADKNPADLTGMEERLRSRLGWGLVADIHPSSYELRMGILQSKAEKLSISVPPRVMEYLAHKITSNIRELEGALNRIVAHAELVGRPVTLETAQDLLRDLLRANDRRITVDDIQRKVAEHFAVKLTDMTSDRRARSVARPRQVAMYLAKTLTQMSLPEIGRKFGGRDHTTVMHAVKKVEELMGADTAFAEDVELLRRALRG